VETQQASNNFKRVALSGLFAVAAATVVLRAMGRTWWCACESSIPWTWDINTSHNSQHLFDPYSLTHVLHGVIFFAVLKLLLPKVTAGRRFLIAVIIESGWEILENSPLIIERYRAATISLNYYGDSIANSLSDIVACAIGYWLARMIGWRWSVALFIAVEVFLLMTIRDCLTLNVLMLLHPSDAIMQWQTGT